MGSVLFVLAYLSEGNLYGPVFLILGFVAWAVGVYLHYYELQTERHKTLGY